MQYRKNADPGAGADPEEGIARSLMTSSGAVPATGDHPEATLLHWRPAETGPRESRYAAAFARAREQALDHHREITAARSAARGAARRLLDEPAQRREMLLRNHPLFGVGGHGGWRLATILVDEVEGGEWGTAGRTPEESLAERIRLAEMAAGLIPEVSPGTSSDPDDPVGPLAADAGARVWRVLGDLQRRRSDLEAAGRSLARARRHLRRGSGDPLERAALLEATGRLLSDRGRRWARACLAGAAKLYAELAETEGEARSRVSLALHVLGEGPGSGPAGVAGSLEETSPVEVREALDELQLGLDLLDPEGAPELFAAGLRRLRQVRADRVLGGGTTPTAFVPARSPSVTGFNELA